MESTKSKRTVSLLISPEPRPLRVRLSKDRQNPFLDKPSLNLCQQEEKAIMDLRVILEKQDSPVSKKGNGGFRYKPPARQKINPIVFDEKFKELNSSASTTEDSISLM